MWVVRPIGVTLVDIERFCPKVNITTGDTEGPDYTDGVHITAPTHAEIAANVGVQLIQNAWA